MSCPNCQCDRCAYERYPSMNHRNALFDLVREQEDMKARIKKLEGEIQHIYQNYIPWIIKQWEKK